MADRDRTLSALEKDFAAILVVELTPVADQARALLLRHQLRAGDAIQLASGLYLQQELGERVLFLAFDSRLVEAARLEGLRIA